MENIENVESLRSEISELQPIESKTETHLSKRQCKKMRKKEKWLERKPTKRLQERAKAKEKKAFARANNICLGPSRKELKKHTMENSSCKVTVVIDLSFDELMIDKDIAKLIKQILRCYTLNRRAAAPMQFALTSFTGRSRQEMEKHNGYENWNVKFHAEPYYDLYAKDKIIYLTSESENVIDNLDETCTYIIGGLVDHNSQKGLCHKLASERGIKHGRLPLDQFLQMKARKVLTIDHVFEILLKRTEDKTWQDIFLQVLPERKKPILIGNEKYIEETNLLNNRMDETIESDNTNDVNKIIRNDNNCDIENTDTVLTSENGNTVELKTW